MTVAQLIDALTSLDPDLPVFYHRPGTTMTVAITAASEGTRWMYGTPAALLVDE